MKSHSRVYPYMRMVTCLVAVVVLCFPLYWIVVTAISPTATLFSPDPSLFPAGRHPTMTGFSELTGSHPAVKWMMNSIILTVGTTVLSLVVSTLAGYSLSRFSGNGQRAMGVTLLLSRMLPGSLLVIPLYITFLKIGLIDSLWSLVVVNTAFVVPFAAWMLKAFFDGIPRELEEAALVDGASQMRALWSVILPLSSGALVAVTTFSAVIAWSDFLFARTLITSTDKWPVTVGLASFLGDYSTDWNAIMALGLISVIPLLLLFVFTERYLVTGLTSGSVKG